MSGSEPSAAPMPVTRAEFGGAARLLGRGLLRRCPWCGDRRAYFTGWFARRDTCRVCDRGYRRGDHAFEYGAVVVNIILTFGLLLAGFAVLVVATMPDMPVLGASIGGVVVALVLPLVLYPVSFTLWQAIDLIMRSPTDDELAGTAEASRV